MIDQNWKRPLIIFSSILFFSGCFDSSTSSVVESSGQTTLDQGGPTPQPPVVIAPPPGSDQNPPSNDNQTPIPPAPIEPPTDSDVMFILNKGIEWTSAEEVEADIMYPVFIKGIEVGTAADCSDSIPQTLSPSFKVKVKNKNKLNTVSIKFIDLGDQVHSCLQRRLLHDDQGPEIVFTKYPLTQLEEYSSTELIYQVSDLSGVKQTDCYLNNNKVECLKYGASVKLNNLAVGSYIFKVTSEDVNGIKSEKSVSWNVVSLYKKVTQTIDIVDDRKVDILMVIDNSGSMNYEQKNMSERVRNFLAILKGLDWQIAVTTTDPRNVNLGDGRLIPIHGLSGRYIIDSSMNAEEAQSRLGMTLQRPETGSGSEQPIYATYRSVERYLANETTHQGFFREGANFAVVVISDEDESANGIKNDPKNLIQLLAANFKSQKVFTWHSIITIPNDKACLSTQGASYGHRLFDFSKLTGGLVGSVCEADYAKQVENIANGIRKMNQTLALTCKPVDKFPILIKKNGVDYMEPYVVEGLNLKFNIVLDPAQYVVEYTCLK